MNKVMTTALIAGGLMLINAPEAAAHKEGRYVYQAPAHYYSYRDEVRRSKHMPRWLKHDHGFRKWFRHSRFKHDRRIGWQELFDIYHWQRYTTRRYSDHYYDDYRRHDRRRDGRRHRH